jgi:hypothetical protein
MESEIVNEEFIKDKTTYNLKEGGVGGWDYINTNKLINSNDNCRKGGLTHHISNDKLGKQISKGRLSSEKRFNGAIAVKKKYPNGTFKDKKHKQESKDAIVRASAIHQKGIRNSQYGTHWYCNDALGITGRKRYKEGKQPNGWITTTEFKKL